MNEFTDFTMNGFILILLIGVFMLFMFIVLGFIMKFIYKVMTNPDTADVKKNEHYKVS